jgi:hypothetical protein
MGEPHESFLRLYAARCPESDWPARLCRSVEAGR